MLFFIIGFIVIVIVVDVDVDVDVDVVTGLWPFLGNEWMIGLDSNAHFSAGAGCWCWCWLGWLFLKRASF